MTIPLCLLSAEQRAVGYEHAKDEENDNGPDDGFGHNFELLSDSFIVLRVVQFVICAGVGTKPNQLSPSQGRLGWRRRSSDSGLVCR
jgi:hypothetical protein